MICNHIENKLCIIHTNRKHCGKCCLKIELNKKDLIFLWPYPCANILREKPKNNCLKCGKTYYPIFFREHEGWIGGTLAQLKYGQMELNNELSQKKQKY